jgi:hypothetical protein
MKTRSIVRASFGLLIFSCIMTGCLSSTLEEYGTPTMVANGDFSGGMSNWWISFMNGAYATVTVEDGAIHVISSHLGRYPSDIMVGQSEPGLACVNGSTYRLSFEAWTSKSYELLTSAVAENGRDVNHDGFNWSSFSYVSYNVTHTRRVFSSTFRMKGTELKARITFFCGKIGSDVYIDNVSFVKVPEK